ncbi:MAG TPA: MarR family winged helix-turn-helix transcriptional regulator [Kofleriaceae bacterium]|nr:MarR family winged helix-turn-helix transcriptional regulator [Kofleriaceae bacterium]
MPKSSSTDPAAAARAYAALFPAVYMRFHRRDGVRRELSGASRAVLLHLAQTGPLTVGECARHLGRAQSVVSEIVDQLEQNQLLARVRDDADRRRTLVWLTDQGRARLADEQEVLSLAALERAVADMAPRDRAMLVAGTSALIAAGDRVASRSPSPVKKVRRKRDEPGKAPV